MRVASLFEALGIRATDVPPSLSARHEQLSTLLQTVVTVLDQYVKARPLHPASVLHCMKAEVIYRPCSLFVVAFACQSPNAVHTQKHQNSPADASVIVAPHAAAELAHRAAACGGAHHAVGVHKGHHAAGG